MATMNPKTQASAQIAADLLAALWSAARAAQARAYAPYLRYAVGAALLDEHGTVHAGCNVENAAYPQGWCAEASALSALVMAGGTRVRAVLVLGGGGADAGGAWITPCGGCRQKLREFCDADVPVQCATSDALGPVYTLEQLLPHSFGPDHLAQP
jgi:cytidine deaminase